MSQLKVNTIRHTGGSSDNITLDNSQNVTIGGDLNLADNKKIELGAGNDLQIYHDGSNSLIEDEGTGGLIIRSQDLTIQGNATTENLARFQENNSVELYYDGTKTFETVSGGTQVPSSHKIYVGVYNNSNGFANFSDGSGSSTLYVGNQSITTSSDQRLKTDIVNTALNATPKLKQVRVVDFKWNDPSDKAINNKNSRGVWTGTLAQEIVDIFPHAVNAPRPEGTNIDTSSSETWGMEYQHLVPVLIKGFQEQQAEIETLKAKVAALEAG